MPRYFFNIRNDISVDEEEGVELPDLAAARAWANKSAVQMAAVSVAEHHHLDTRHRIEVVSEFGQALLTVHFGDLVKVEP